MTQSQIRQYYIRHFRKFPCKMPALYALMARGILSFCIVCGHRLDVMLKTYGWTWQCQLACPSHNSLYLLRWDFGDHCEKNSDHRKAIRNHLYPWNYFEQNISNFVIITVPFAMAYRRSVFFYLWLSKGSVNYRRRYICNDFSHWLRSC